MIPVYTIIFRFLDPELLGTKYIRFKLPSFFDFVMVDQVN